MLWISLQVKELVEAELFARYDRLLLQSTLDRMADVVYCPRPSCQLPVMQEPSCTMGICSSCNFAFCTLCRLTYHGVSPCKVTAGTSSLPALTSHHSLWRQFRSAESLVQPSLLFITVLGSGCVVVTRKGKISHVCSA